MADEKKDGKPGLKASVQLEREVPFMELVREARDLEQLPQFEPKPSYGEPKKSTEDVAVSIPAYAEMSYSEILSELKKIDKIKATLNYSGGIAAPIPPKFEEKTAPPKIEKKEEPPAKPHGRELKIEPEKPKPAPIQFAQEPKKPAAVETAPGPKLPQKEEAGKPDFNLKEITAQEEKLLPKPEEKARKSSVHMMMEEKPAELKPKDVEKHDAVDEEPDSVSLAQQIARATAKARQEKKRDPELGTPESIESLAQQIAKARGAVSEEKQPETPLVLEIRPKPELKPKVEIPESAPRVEIEKTAPKPAVITKPPEPKQAEKPVVQETKEAKPGLEPKTFNWPASPKPAPATEEKPAPAEKKEEPKKGGLFSGITGLLARGKSKKPNAPAPEQRKVEAPKKEAPKVEPPKAVEKSVATAPKEPQKPVLPPEEPEEPQDMITRIEETKKRIASMRAQKGAKPDAEVDLEQLEKLGKYKRERKEPEGKEDPLARLREYRKKRKEEWDGK